MGEVGPRLLPEATLRPWLIATMVTLTSKEYEVGKSVINNWDIRFPGSETDSC